MLKKLFGKKSKLEKQEGVVSEFSSNQMVMPPMTDFYHNGMPPSFMGMARSKNPYQASSATQNGFESGAAIFPSQPFFSYPNISNTIRENHEYLSTCADSAEANHGNLDGIRPEQMALYQHMNLQEYFCNECFQQSDAMRELEKSREVEMADDKLAESSEPFNGFEQRLKELEDKEIYGVRVNGKNYGYHFGFHDPKCEIPAYQKEKVQMNHVRIGKMSGRVVALHVWCDEKDAELSFAETIYVRLEMIDALILYASQALQENESENEWKLELLSEQKANSFRLHTINETYLLEEIQCDSNIFGQIRVDYKIIGMGTDDVILDYTFWQKKSGEKASIQRERLKIYIPVDKVVSIETK